VIREQNHYLAPFKVSSKPIFIVMKKVAVAFVIFFLAGWAVRILVPYWESKSLNQELNSRKQAITLLIDAIYQYAETNNGHFPRDLNQLFFIQNAGTAVIVTNYYYNIPQSNRLGNVDDKKIVVAEKDKSFPERSIYYVGLQGKWVVRKKRDEYLRLLTQNGITNAP
jgi:predicted MPP superfamily phosphohydrolase